MSALILPSSRVSAKWLAENIDHPQLVVLDASWFMPGAARDGYAEWQQQRIPHAQYFDFDKKIADTNAALPHMLPSPDVFAREVGVLGISNDSVVVVYDSQGIFSSPRVWWMFRAMGHSQVAVLDGGLPAWRQAGYALETKTPETVTETDFVPHYDPTWVIDSDTLHQALSDPQNQIFDARPAERFYGLAPEPREGVRSGHMPYANSLPFSQLLEKGHLLPVEQLQQRFDALSDPEQQLIFSCGSGVTACILALAADIAGRKHLTVYDGSWTEWGSEYRYPVE
ncbi:sulfurtransferase [Photobacterium japonica]|uniref:sulfurtransferase n=1 Tax=Photobacterium japonica TaxID=2910235 RepID=UPI003D1453A5